MSAWFVDGSTWWPIVAVLRLTVGTAALFLSTSAYLRGQRQRQARLALIVVGMCCLLLPW